MGCQHCRGLTHFTMASIPAPFLLIQCFYFLSIDRFGICEAQLDKSALYRCKVKIFILHDFHSLICATFCKFFFHITEQEVYGPYFAPLDSDLEHIFAIIVIIIINIFNLRINAYILYTIVYLEVLASILANIRSNNSEK